VHLREWERPGWDELRDLEDHPVQVTASASSRGWAAGRQVLRRTHRDDRRGLQGDAAASDPGTGAASAACPASTRTGCCPAEDLRAWVQEPPVPLAQQRPQERRELRVRPPGPAREPVRAPQLVPALLQRRRVRTRHGRPQGVVRRRRLQAPRREPRSPVCQPSWRALSWRPSSPPSRQRLPSTPLRALRQGVGQQVPRRSRKPI
jgi:hypothetical protein